MAQSGAQEIPIAIISYESADFFFCLDSAIFHKEAQNIEISRKFILKASINSVLSKYEQI